MLCATTKSICGFTSLAPATKILCTRISGTPRAILFLPIGATRLSGPSSAGPARFPISTYAVPAPSPERSRATIIEPWTSPFTTSSGTSWRSAIRKRFAVNFSDWLAIADGISYTQYKKLEEILGPKYSERIVSAENLITDFRVRRTIREVAAFIEALEIHRQILERSLSNEVITPGVTTRADVGWWVKEQFFKRGLTQGFRTRVGTPGVIYSAVSDRDTTRSPDYVLQRGDFLSFDNGVRYLDYYQTDYKRNAYIMREGETSVPAPIQLAYDRAIAARGIIRQHVKVGKTAGQTLEDLIAALKDADYIYTPFTDRSPEDYENLQKALANTDKSGFSIDLHSEGNRNGGLETLGPSIAAFRRDRDDLVVQENHLFSLEFLVNTNHPDRPGFPMVLNIEGNHIVSSRGVEFLHPPNERILLIH